MKLDKTEILYIYIMRVYRWGVFPPEYSYLEIDNILATIWYDRCDTNNRNNIAKYAHHGPTITVQ